MIPACEPMSEVRVATNTGAGWRNSEDLAASTPPLRGRFDGLLSQGSGISSIFPGEDPRDNVWGPFGR